MTERIIHDAHAEYN